MSSGTLKGLEVILIAGLVFWFAYSQLKALKTTKPTEHSGEAGGAAHDAKSSADNKQEA